MSTPTLPPRSDAMPLQTPPTKTIAAVEPSVARGQNLRKATRFLRRAKSWRLMREPSMLAREVAAEQLEERQGNWAYSKLVVFLAMVWNLMFIVVTVGVLVLSRHKSPLVPLRR